MKAKKSKVKAKAKKSPTDTLLDVIAELKALGDDPALEPTVGRTTKKAELARIKRIGNIADRLIKLRNVIEKAGVK